MDATKFATTTAFIVILDVNDNPPKFEEDSYNSTLSESSDFGTTVVTVTATDEDEVRCKTKLLSSLIIMIIIIIIAIWNYKVMQYKI